MIPRTMLEGDAIARGEATGARRSRTWRRAPVVLALVAAGLVAGCGEADHATGSPGRHVGVDAGAAASDAGGAADAGAGPQGVWARDYEGACPAKTVPSWNVFTWAAVTPDDARIALFARTGDTKPLAEAAPRVELVTASSQSGNSAFFNVGERLGADRAERWLVVEGDLYASSKGDLPVMKTAAMSLDCLPAP